MIELDALVQKAKEIKEEIGELQEKEKSKKKEYAELMEDTIPSTMATNNMKEYVNLAGDKVSFKVDYRGSHAKARAKDELAFLAKHNEAGGFKKVFQIEIPYMPNGHLDEIAETVRTYLDSRGVYYAEDDKIHPQSLDAALRRLMPKLHQEGLDADIKAAEELLRAASFFKTTIKESKK